MKLRGRVTVAGRQSSWRAALGIVFVYAGVDLLTLAVRQSYAEGRTAAEVERQADGVAKLVEEIGEQGGATAGESGDGPRDAAGES